MKARQFSFHSGVSSQPPQSAVTALIEKADTDTVLTRDEKNRLANFLYGVGGSHSAIYKLLGWAWDAYRAKQVQRILVSYSYEPSKFQAYYAPDKTSLRLALDDSNIAEMIYAPRKVRKNLT